MTEHAGQSTESQDTAPWTTGRLMRWMTEYFRERAVDSPRLCGEMLLAYVLGCERMRLYMEVDRPASTEELARLRGLVIRAGRHEPVQYLVREAWFFGLPFAVDRSTLIPRPSTETLVECALRWHRQWNDAVPSRHLSSQLDQPASPEEPRAAGGPRIADIGTGTGCIAVSLARQIPAAEILATDLIEDAIALARSNARRHGVEDRIEFRVGSLYEPLSGPAGQSRPFDLICSNPPYIPDHEWDDVQRNVKDYESATALRGGPDGLDVIRPLIARAAEHLAPRGRLLVEIAHCHRQAAMDLVIQAPGLSDPQVLKDHEGLWRVLIASRAG